MRKFLLKCRANSVTLNKNKFEYVKDNLKFVGFIVTRIGIRVDPEKTRALEEFPTPKSQAELKSFLGLANQSRKFSKDFGNLTGHIRDLLRWKTLFMWLPEHEEAFEIIKELCRMSMLCNFDPNTETGLHTDASKTKGL